MGKALENLHPSISAVELLQYIELNPHSWLTALSFWIMVSIASLIGNSCDDNNGIISTPLSHLIFGEMQDSSKLRLRESNNEFLTYYVIIFVQAEQKEKI